MKQAHILVVEDDPDLQEVLRRTLERDGHTVEMAGDGRRAFDLVYGADYDFDLILADLHLPCMTGTAFLEEVYPFIERKTPVIVTSGVTHLIEALGEIRRGALGVLEKPYQTQDLLDMIARGLHQRALLLRLHELERKVQVLSEKNRHLVRRSSELFQQARLDPLTGLPNRRRLQEDLHVIDANLRRYTTPLAIALVDVDDFGRFNKQHSLEVGDQVLRHVAQSLRIACRQGDLVYRFESGPVEPAFRYGGDEFMLLLAAQDEASAVAAMDRIRERLLVEQADWGGALARERVTVSIGVVANDPDRQLTVEELIHHANDRLREAKADGGNCTRPSVPVESQLLER